MTLLSTRDSAMAQVTTRRRILVRPATELPQMTRYRGGTYSHTIDRIVFTDGSTARTDLIRLNPNLDAYSLDFSGIAPHLPSRYRLGTWTALPHLRTRASEARVDWILRHSFPIRSIGELSQQLRDAGYPLGAGNISEHEAIAGTQAAIWHLTNGLALDVQRLNVPVAVKRGPGPVITFQFDGQPQLGGYSVWTTSDTSVSMRLQKSANGVDWQDVSGSKLITDPARGIYRRALGVGSTLSASRHGHRGHGYRFYRLIATAESNRASGTENGMLKIGHVSFWLTGSRHFRNADRVVHLYNYLLAGAASFPRETDHPALIDREATASSGLIGPFQVRASLEFNASNGHELVDADGFAIDGVVEPGTDFYVRAAPGASSATLTATLPATERHRVAGRVLTGVAPNAPERFTPVALTVAADVAIQFDIRWNGECEHR